MLRSQITFEFGTFGCRIFYLNSGNLICRSTGISMYFRESLAVRDNESLLYINNYRTESKLTSKFGEFISPAEVALVRLKFILSFIKFCSLVTK